MFRDEEAALNLMADQARRRLDRGFESGREVIEQYRAKLFAIKAADEFSRGQLLLAGMAPSGRTSALPARHL